MGVALVAKRIMNSEKHGNAIHWLYTFNYRSFTNRELFHVQ